MMPLLLLGPRLSRRTQPASSVSTSISPCAHASSADLPSHHRTPPKPGTSHLQQCPRSPVPPTDRSTISYSCFDWGFELAFLCRQPGAQPLQCKAQKHYTNSQL